MHRGRGRSRSNRKTRWTGATFQGNVVFEGDVNNIGIGLFTWVSFWFKWPAGHLAPHIGGEPAEVGARVEPSDETLVRTRQNFDALAVYGTTINSLQSWNVAAGLIAFDGGDFPTAYDLATFTTSSIFAPPNPVIDPGDDWLLRNTYGIAGQALTLIGDTTDGYTQSLAKRKLPPDTGILGVIGVENLIQGDEETLQLVWNWDARFAVRTGYTA